MFPVIVLSLLVAASVTDAATSFIRWGRTTCPAGTIALYKGYMAGPGHAVSGSGSNFLCMIDKPQFVRPIPGRQAASGLIQGVEFENTRGKYSNLFSNENLPNGDISDQDMPCVRCYVHGSSDHMMLPGRQDCGLTGYDLQYKGFLVSEYHPGDSWPEPRGRSSYVCLDEAPEGITGGQGDNNQGVVYAVEIACGSLPCNPYVDGYEVTCAVCTY